MRREHPGRCRRNVGLVPVIEAHAVSLLAPPRTSRSAGRRDDTAGTVVRCDLGPSTASSP